MIFDAGQMPLAECGLEDILDSLPLAIYVKDKELNYTWGNAPFGLLCKCKKHEVAGKQAKSYFDDTITDAATRNDLLVLETGQSQVFDASVNCCEHERTLRFVKMPAIGKNGEIAGVISVAMDRDHAAPGEKDLMNALRHLQSDNERLQKHALDLEVSLRFAEENAAEIVAIAESTAAERDRLSRHTSDLESSLAYTQDNASHLVELAEELDRQRREIEAHNARIQELMYRDDTTGLHNRRYFYEAAPRHLQTHLRADETAALAVLDLDEFKRVNDRFGHHAGDEALSGFARRVNACLPDNTIFCRIGGEEFAVMTPPMDKDDAVNLMDTVRKRVAENHIAVDGGQIPCTVSIGATMVNRSHDLGTILQKADTAMYAAKNNGRNRVLFLE
jgi:diguanylate cyclase (GGDEF)-like protein